MNSSEIKIYRDHFDKYTYSFLGTDQYKNKNYILKQDHTKRVCKNILSICSSLGLSDAETNITETIALYHDIGRFIQFQKYKTFSDSKSENHALLGIKVLKEEKILDKSIYKKLILSAIGLHNVKNIPEHLKNSDILYLKIIRDADKLDILNVLTGYYVQKKTDNPALDLDLPYNSEYSQKVLDEFFLNRCIDIKYLKSSLDFKILQLSWIFDINFKHTLYIIKKKKYFEKIMSVLPVNSKTEQINSHIKKLIN